MKDVLINKFKCWYFDVFVALRRAVQRGDKWRVAPTTRAPGGMRSRRGEQRDNFTLTTENSGRPRGHTLKTDSPHSSPPSHELSLLSEQPNRNSE